jgi:hypothetical protein
MVGCPLIACHAARNIALFVCGEGTEHKAVEMGGKEPDRRPISVGETALWDEELDAFRVKAQGNRDIAGVVILRWANLPISHLDSSSPNKQTRLGQFLRERLEIQINASVTRGERTAPEGLALLRKEEEPKR